MQTNQILNEVARLHASAIQSGTLLVEGVRYTLRFNGRNYITAGPDGLEIAEFNTRKISVAKKWLREYLAN